MNKVCAFFGHRDIQVDVSDQLEQKVREVITEYGATTFWCGGYGSFDSCSANIVKRLKKDFPQIELQLILAYLPTESKKISNIYDSFIYPKGLELVPRRFAIDKRNQWIVNNCDILITYIDRSYGGAYTAYRHAKLSGKPVINLGSFIES